MSEVRRQKTDDRISDCEFKNAKAATKIRISHFEFRNLNSMLFAYWILAPEFFGLGSQ